jgi:linoleoyl-CoA desaturase
MQKVKFVDPEKRMFFNTLKSRVDQYFKDKKLSPHANFTMILKTIVLLGFYILPFVVLVWLPMAFGFKLLLWALMGFAVAGVGMSIMHDANHGAYSKYPWVNRLVGYSINLLGASTHNWKLQHNLLHHTYTNVLNMDEDIADKGILRFSPHTEVKGIHRYQWIFAPLFYGIMTLYWVTVKDFVQFTRYHKKGLAQNSPLQATFVFLRIIILKIAYFSVLFGVPILLGAHTFGAVLAGFLVMHLVAGIVLTLIFQLAHTVEGTSHPIPDAAGCIQNEWAIHQMNTTVNFSPRSRFLTWYCGGLNYQVEHHLFPRVCHVYYPKISKIVKETAAEFGVPYLENETFGKALSAHFSTLKRFGRLPDLTEGIG